MRFLPHDTSFFSLFEQQGKKTDRKSTRLNSSHLVISYAVFCLKKKRYDRARQRRENAHDAAKQRGVAGAVRPDDCEHGTGGDLASEVVHRRVPVIPPRVGLYLQW